MPLSFTYSECMSKVVHSFSFASHLPLLCIKLWQIPHLLDSILHIDARGLVQWCKLHGVIYFLGEHFTSRVITSNGMVWFHDRLFTGNSLVYKFVDISSIRLEDSTLAVYIQDNQ